MVLYKHDNHCLNAAGPLYYFNKDIPMIFLILTRILDIYSTMINVERWGYEIEGNPIIRKLMENGLFIPAQVFGVSLVILVAETLPKHRKIIYVSISSLSLLASAINFYCYLFIN